ncbi:TIGR03619 family F420-dependent LLM class oxidoreductase [Rhodococcus opacus]|uniref:TIGR03619 family F420-dependent LLM class oxidoreductase n=1 Tax=Rhodococcus opacus TaxID=37919 RepID=UPI0024752A0C|nr:TIGR03619 family F420-dependent LLM class oxidoreductase [Rhodococcus opacus]MDH6292841.1 putative F420-dependent oxidoreductase [Rhodococcus opacus]
MDIMVSLPLQAFIRDLRKGSSTSIRDCVQGLEDLGYWGVNVVDHILQSDTDAAEHHAEADWNWRFPEYASTMGYLAAITQRLRIGVRVLVVPYRKPIQVAHAFATIDSLSGGRAVVGVGPGYDVEEFRRLSVPRNKRGKLTDEYLDVMQALWAADGPIDFEGETIQFKGAQLQVGPVQRPGPPLWIGGNSQAALARAVRVGDAWTPMLYGYTFRSPGDGRHVLREELPDMMDWANKQRAAAGLPALECIPGSGVPWNITDRPAHPGRRPEEIQQFSAIGTVDEILEEYQLFYQAGCRRFSIRLAGADTDDFLRQADIFANQIMPFISK